MKAQRMNSKRGQCWICKSRTDLTDEHKIPSAIYRRRNFSKNSDPIRVIPHQNLEDKYSKHVQGPRSQELCFRKIICSCCNNDRTSKSDNSFVDAFNYIENNKERIANECVIDWELCYGKDWGGRLRSFIQWLAKHAGCVMVENGIQISEDIRNYILGNATNKTLGYSVVIKIRSVEILEPYTYFSEPCSLYCSEESKAIGLFDGVAGWISLGNVTFRYFVCPHLDGRKFMEMKKKHKVLRIDSPDQFSIDTSKSVESNAISILRYLERYPFKKGQTEWKDAFVSEMINSAIFFS